MNWNTWKKLRNAKLRNAKEDPTLAGHTGLCVLATLSRLSTSTAIQRHFLPASLAGRTRMWAHQPCLYCSEAFSSSSICCFEMQRHLRVCAARMGPLPLPRAPSSWNTGFSTWKAAGTTSTCSQCTSWLLTSSEASYHFSFPDSGSIFSVSVPDPSPDQVRVARTHFRHVWGLQAKILANVYIGGGKLLPPLNVVQDDQNI